MVTKKLDFRYLILMLLADQRRHYSDPEIVAAIPRVLLQWLLDSFQIPRASESDLTLAGLKLMAIATEQTGLSQRISHGLQSAIEEGKAVGRPRKVNETEVWQLHDQGMTPKQIKKELQDRGIDVCENTIRRYISGQRAG